MELTNPFGYFHKGNMMQKENIQGQHFSEKQIMHLHETFSSTIVFSFNVNFMSMPYRRRLDK